jgi:RAD51-like protein 3
MRGEDLKMNLQTLLPSLPEHIQRGLLDAGIITVYDILFSNIPKLYQRLPPGLLSLRELGELRTDVAAHVAAVATRGDELFAQQEQHEIAREKCLCKIEQIDELLSGFGRYGVIEIAGDKMSGKTVSYACLYFPKPGKT